MDLHTKQKNGASIAIHYRVSELSNALGVSAGTIWRGVRVGTFPQPIKPFPRVTAWRKSDVDAWLATKSEGGAK